MNSDRMRKYFLLKKSFLFMLMLMFFIIIVTYSIIEHMTFLVTRLKVLTVQFLKEFVTSQQQSVSYLLMIRC